MNLAVNQCNFERITRSLRRVRTNETSRQARQDVALASLGFCTLGELEDAIADAEETGTSLLRREEFRQKRAHMARAAACCEAVFSLPDLEQFLGPIDKVARDAVLTSLRRCQPLVLEPLPIDPSTIKVPGLTPDIVQMILAGQHKAGCWDAWVPHQCLFEHRHAEPSPPFHAEIVETFHSSDPGWVYLCFRNSGKSTLSEEGFILRALLRLFGNALVLGFNQQHAVERLEAIKHEMETNERLGAIFGDVRGQVWQGQKVVLTSGVCLQAVGSGQSLRGIKHLTFRPDCLLLDDVEGDIGASTPLEREDTKRWFFGTVLPSLASRSIIRMAATPLDAECLPVTLGKMPTWKTMVVPVRSIGGNENAFFESWCAEQDLDVGSDAISLPAEPDQSRSRTLDKIKQLIAANERPDGTVLSTSASIEQLAHVAEERPPEKSFDLVHGADRGSAEAGQPSAPDVRPPHRDDGDPSEVEAPKATLTPKKQPPKPLAELSDEELAERLANAERQRRFRERRRAGMQDIPDSKSETPAPSPPIEPETQRELTAVEKAMAFSFGKDRR